MSKAGRPKTGAGHRDDAMLDMLEFRKTVGDLLTLKQQHYREERDLITALASHVDDATVSWRYGEIADSICIAGTAA